MHHYLLSKIRQFSVLLLLLTSVNSYADYTAENRALLNSIPQDAANYLPSNGYSISHINQKPRTEKYLTRYFEPWEGKKLTQSLADIKQSESAIIKGFRKKPGIGANSLEHDSQWVDQLASNMNVASFPNLNMKAITVRNSDVRQLPTEDTSFSAWNVEGNGFPFDNMQTSLVSANTPIRVLHTSRDGSWYLILTPNYYGWVPSYDVAFVDSDFIRQWQSRPKLVPRQDIMATARKLSDPSVQLRIGTLYPLAAQTGNTYQIYVAAADSNHQAVLKQVTVSKRYLAAFPLPISTSNAVKIANQMLGQPYGWGGMYGFRDCSATIMDLMTTMGIWLPRNSAAQANVGQKISLARMSDAEKQQTIIKYGVPLFTLIHLPGHIMLYIGEKNGEAFVFHDGWSLRGTAVSSLQVRPHGGKTLLNLTDSMAVLVNS